MKTEGAVAERKTKKGAQEVDKQSNGRHALKLAYDKRREFKQDCAILGRIHREYRTPEQQLALLDERLGIGVGAKIERARLKLQMLTFVGGEIVTSMEGNRAAKQLEIAKMESRGYRIMRRLGLSERELPKFGCIHAGVASA